LDKVVDFREFEACTKFGNYLLHVQRAHFQFSSFLIRRAFGGWCPPKKPAPTWAAFAPLPDRPHGGLRAAIKLVEFAANFISIFLSPPDTPQRGSFLIRLISTSARLRPFRNKSSVLADALARTEHRVTLDKKCLGGMLWDPSGQQCANLNVVVYKLSGHRVAPIPGIARVSRIESKLCFAGFGPNLIRDAFHWIRVAETSNLLVFLRL